MLPPNKPFDVRTLPHVRVTGMGSFEKCPANWAVNTFGTEVRKDSPYATMGTAVHKVVELYLRKQLDPDKRVVNKYLRDSHVSAPEIQNVWDYLDTLSVWRDNLIACEHEFILTMKGFGLPIMGHIDVAFRAEGGMLIIDHKTNRRFQPKEWWQKQFQPLLYCWAARQLWPEHTQKLYYQIGYVNLGTVVYWETDRKDDARVTTRMQKIWKDMEVASETQQFPAILNQDCGYCPIKETCGTYRGEFNSLISSFTGSVAERSIPEQYLWITAVRKAAEKAEDDIKEKMLEMIQEAGGTLAHGEATFERVYSSRRKAEYTPTREALKVVADEMPLIAPLILEAEPSLYSVKVGGLDNLAKRAPMLKPIIEQLALKVESGSPSILMKETSAES